MKVLLVGFQLVRCWVSLPESVVRMQSPSCKWKVSISPIILHEVFAPTDFNVFSLHYMLILFSVHQSFAHVRIWLVILCGLKDLMHFEQVYVLFWFRLSVSVTLISFMPILLLTAIFFYSCAIFFMLLFIDLTSASLLIIPLHLSLHKVALLQLWIWHFLRSSSILSSTKLEPVNILSTQQNLPVPIGWSWINRWKPGKIGQFNYKIEGEGEGWVLERRMIQASHTRVWGWVEQLRRVSALLKSLTR